MVNVAAVEAQDLLFLLTLPEHYQKTVMSLVPSQAATAQDIADRTGRARAVESMYLNNLATMGIVSKERKGRTVYFSYRNANAEITKAIKRLRKLSAYLRRIVLDDTLTALNSRITTFEHLRQT
jgi:predicted transcriptional regulator